MKKGSQLPKLGDLLASRIFFYSVVGISILQGVWYALTFRPHIYDEGIHLGFIGVYAGRLNPFINKQPPSLDYLGDVTRNVSYLYYYLMSWPLRFINLVTDNLTLKVILLRLINVALFAAGLILYRQLFIKAGAPKNVSNLALLLLILTPSLAPLSGAVNYDNAVFLLSALILLVALNIIQNRQISFRDIALLIILGLLSSLVKFEVLALFVPVVLYLGYSLGRKHNKRVFSLIVRSYKKSSKASQLLLISSLLISAGLFIERPIINLLKYHKLVPDCVQLLSEQRCKANYTAQRDISARADKPAHFSPMNPFNYALQEWVPGMVTTQTTIPPTRLSSSILRLGYYAAALFGSGLIIYYLRSLIRKPAFKLLLFVGILYTLFLFIYNYLDYAALGQVIAVTGRYLLPTMPIFILFVLMSLAKLIKSNRYRLASVVIAGLLFTQGGGITTYLLATNHSDYWRGSLLSRPNTFMKNRLKTFVRLGEVN